MNQETYYALADVKTRFANAIKQTADLAASLYYVYAKDELQPKTAYWREYLNLADMSRGNFVSSREALLMALELAIRELQCYGGKKAARRIGQLETRLNEYKDEEHLSSRYEL